MGVSDHGRLGDHSRRPQRMGGTVSIVVQEYCGSIATLLREASRGWWRRLRGSASTSSVSSLGTRSGPPGLAAGEGGSCRPGILIEERRIIAEERVSAEGRNGKCVARHVSVPQAGVARGAPAWHP